MVDHVGWRSIFAVAVPVGVATIALAARSVGRTRLVAGRRLDVAGQVLAASGLALLAYAIIERSSPAGRPRLLGLAAAGAVAALLAFALVERRAREPLVPLAIFRRVPFSAALAVAGSMTFGMYGLLLLVPLSLQAARGMSAFQTGLVLLPMSLAFALTSPASGALAERLGPRVPMASGMALIGAGFLALAALPLDGALAPVVLALALPGVGMGLNTGPAMAVAVASAPPERSGMASGLVNVARMVGATLGVAALGAAFAAMGGPRDPRALAAALHLGAGDELAGALVALLLVSRRAHHRDAQ
jgi:predicted MFS family arabinose efflux permease